MSGLALDPRARVDAAASQLARVRELLTDPTAQNLEECRSALRSVAALLALDSQSWVRHAGDGELLAQVQLLRQSIANAHHLLRTAADRHRKWLQILRSKTGGYTACGKPAELNGASRLCLRG